MTVTAASPAYPLPNAGIPASELLHHHDATRAAVEGAGLMLLVVSAEGRILDANPVACERLGYPLPALLQLGTEAVDPGLDIATREQFWRVLRSGGVIREERTFQTRGGERFPVEIAASVGRYGDGSVALVLARDIGERREAEAHRRRVLERREAEARLLAELAVHPGVAAGDVETVSEWLLEGARELMDVTSASLWLVGDEGQSLRLHRLASLRRDPTPGDVVLDVANYPTYFRHLHRGEIIDAADAARDPRTAELSHFLAPNGIRAMLDVPMFLSGELRALLCFELADRPREWTPEEMSFARALAQIAVQALLTRERIHDLEALRQSEQRLRLAQRAAGVGSWEWRADGDAVWWSDHLYALFGVTPDRVTPSMEAFLGLVHPDDRLRVRQALADAVARGDGAQFDYRLIRPNGDERCFLEASHVERDPSGRALRIIGTALDITERRQQAQRIEELAFYDNLTGLPNRALFADRIERCIAVSRRLHTGFALLFLDLDNFKQVNDSLGHSQGDALLREVARRLMICLREQDTVSRLGGDEFVILLPGLTDTDAVAAVAHRLLGALRAPVQLGEIEVTASTSMGISCFPEDGEDAETLIRNADTAMYAAKASGRDGMSFFTPSMNAQAVRRLSIEAGLRRALEREEFELHYQPVFAIKAGQVYGAEALLRWHDPARGLIPPGEFLGVAEQSGLILPIGDWVMYAACRQAQAWRQAGLQPVPVLVNLSAMQLTRGNVVALVERALADTGLPPEGLCVEITESTLMERVDDVLPMLHRLREIGVRIAVDDFGTGYSSLAYLSQLPLNVLKIDRSFVQAADREHHPAVITKAVINLARDLGLMVVAEGVETQSQLDWLRGQGCNAYQGFLRFPPLPPGRFVEEVLSA